MRLLMIAFAAIMLFGCAEDVTVEAGEKLENTADQREELAGKIEKLEEMVKADQERLDMKSRKQLLIAYANYANNFHADEKTPEYLFRGAKLANELGKPNRAIEYLTNVHDGYPQFDKRTEAAFLVGFIHENVLNDKEMAQKAYEKVIELYPESKWAEDAQASIELLYLTDEEKIERFKQLNQ